jgi:hypothetical protein
MMSIFYDLKSIEKVLIYQNDGKESALIHPAPFEYINTLNPSREIVSIAMGYSANSSLDLYIETPIYCRYQSEMDSYIFE